MPSSPRTGEEDSRNHAEDGAFGAKPATPILRRVRATGFVLLSFLMPWLLLAVFAPRAMVDSGLNLWCRLAGFSLQRTVVEGITVAYLDGGGDGSPLVIVPGYSDDSRTWMAVARDLQSVHRVLIPDPPGFGRSPADADAGYTFPEQTRRLRGFLDALHLPRVAVMGESMGGGVVASLAAHHPDRVTTVTLLCPAGIEAPKLSPFWQEFRRGNNLLIPQTDEQLRAMMHMISADPPALPAFVREGIVREMQRNAPLLGRVFRELRSGGDFQIQAFFAGISAPLVVMWGDQDRLLDPSGIEIIAQSRPDARRVVLDDCGHTLHLDCPDRIVQHHLELAAEVPASR